MKKGFLVNEVLPAIGNSCTAREYRTDLMSKGYNRFQAIGSLGGASNGKSVTIGNNGSTVTVIRRK